jgi:hypothetical protein
MDIIAIRNVREGTVRKFFEKWWPIEGVMKVDPGWVSIFVSGTQYFGSVSDYAELISIEMEKVVIYIKGNSGAVDRFCIYENGIYCPISKAEAEQPGMMRKNECWYLENRLSPWGIGEQDQWAIRGSIGRFDTENSAHFHASESALCDLAKAVAKGLALPRLWEAATIEEIASESSCKPM